MSENGIDEQLRQHLSSVAESALDTMENVDSSVRDELDGRRQEQRKDAHVDVLARPVNALVGRDEARIAEAVRRPRQEVTKALHILREVPILARVTAEDEDGHQRLFFVCPTRPPDTADLDGTFVSKNSPLGRLAELNIGEEGTVRTPRNDLSFTVVERLVVTPRFDGAEWDGIRNTFASDEGWKTISSLRRIVGRGPEEDHGVGDPLAEVLAEDLPFAAVLDGRRREALEHMALRNAPILDQYQGEVFRMPIDDQLVLLGPAGTGKTTTLVRRIGQKCDPENLFEEERHILGQIDPDREVREIAQNWVMFTPTELLRLYLKEAFSREGVAAPDSRVQTWNDCRRRLAREVFNILPIEGKSRLQMDAAEGDRLARVDGHRQQDVFEDFEHHHVQASIARLRTAAETLATNDDAGTARLAQSYLQRLSSASTLNSLARLAVESRPARELLQSFVNDARDIIDDHLRVELRRDRGFLSDLSKFMDTIGAGQRRAVVEDGDEDADEDADEDETHRTPAERGRIEIAVTLYRSALRSLSLATLQGRRLGSNSTAARVVEWLAGRLPEGAVLERLGWTHIALRELRRLRNAAILLVRDVPKNYRRFRQDREKSSQWFTESTRDTALRNSVEPAEVDMIILAMLRASRELFAVRPAWNDGRETPPGLLEGIRGEFKTQVLVDEVTDFSPVQVACMHALTHPKLRSFFACGDLRQRLTTGGISTLHQLHWAVPKLDLCEVKVGYRQSRRLAELASEIVRLPAFSDDSRQPEELELGFDHEGAAPLLGENVADGALARWLCERVREIAAHLDRLPTVAIFVNGDARIKPLVRAIEPLLRPHNIDVIACLEGRILGGDGAVRVFDIEHIKGLEFEAAFFVGLDRIAERRGGLLGNFLYVGVTRAATYLGITCEGALPETLEPLRTQFSTGSWRAYPESFAEPPATR